ncbi:MAG: TIGR03546 family protein [Nitrospirota bacterium]|nr:TIGR03546 family protein [Nitrospirota bacterium]
MLSMIAKLLKVLNSEADPFQISVALGLSMITGFLPLFTPLNLLILLLVLVLRVNISSYLLGSAFFAGIAWFLDPIFHRIGLAVLTAGALEGSWTALYNTVLGRLQRFNNSVVMGSVIFSALFFVPLVLLLNIAIRKYRDHVLLWVKKTRFMQILMASKFYDLYEKLS